MSEPEDPSQQDPKRTESKQITINLLSQQLESTFGASAANAAAWCRLTTHYWTLDVISSRCEIPGIQITDALLCSPECLRIDAAR
jgi:hypothetical protein